MTDLTEKLDGTGIRITSVKPAGIKDGMLRLEVTADTSELTGALATMKAELQGVAAALNGLPAEFRRDSEIFVRINGDVWAAGEGRAIANMCEDYGRMTVRRASDPETYWIPAWPECPFYAAGVAPKQGNGPRGRYIGVRCEECDGVPGFVVRPDPEHPSAAVS